MHGHYDPLLDDLFAGVVHIVHAGDFGTLDVLQRLQRLAPLTVVCGNVDIPTFGEQFPWTAEAEIAGLRFLVGHVGKSLMGAHDPVAEGYNVVISGHSHKPAIEWRGETLFRNPGSAGRPRFSLPRTAALIEVVDGRPQPRIVTLG